MSRCRLSSMISAGLKGTGRAEEAAEAYLEHIEEELSLVGEPEPIDTLPNKFVRKRTFKQIQKDMTISLEKPKMMLRLPTGPIKQTNEVKQAKVRLRKVGNPVDLHIP